MTSLIPFVTRLCLGFCAALLVLAIPLGALAQSRDITVMIPPDAEQSKISVVVTPNLSHTKRLPNADLRQARKDMLAGIEISDDNLTALARHNDGLAAQKLVQRLLADGAGKHASDIAYYGSIAVSTGRVKSLRPAVAAMLTLDPATEPKERLQVYEAMLYAHAWAGNPLALDAVMDLNGEGKLFGELSDKTRAKIEEQGQKAGDGRVALRLAVGLMDGLDAPAPDLQRAHDYLAQAAAGNNFTVKTTATNLLDVLVTRMVSQ
jgi:hypothetical protein